VSVDFGRVAVAALAQAERLCSEWLGGKRQGNEWLGARRVEGGLGDSWSVNLTTGAWLHGAGDEKGGDIVSLYAALNHVDQVSAAHAVADLCGYTNGAARTQAVLHTDQACEPIPDTDPPAHPDHGAPQALYRYGSAFIVARYQTTEGKTFCPWTYRNGRWARKSFPAPRPLYGVAELVAKPAAPVLIVEGEKCADAARAVMPAYACVTWAGGAQAVKTADWSPLTGRDVLIWPDADEPGIKAATALAGILLLIAKRVRVIRPQGQPEGWDIANAIADGWALQKITNWWSGHSTELHEPSASPTLQVGRPHDSRPPVAQSGDSAVASWQQLGLECNSGGVPFPTIGNCARILGMHPQTRGRIWYDLFRSKVMHTKDGRTIAWKDQDDLLLVDWLQQTMKLPKIGLQTAHHAVELEAFKNARNSVVEWLESLTWDATPRLSEWLSDFLGAPGNPYTQAVARNWLISMVARAYKPGCQADHMPVLEGLSGLGKSATAGIIGGEWYRAAPQAFGSREFLEAIQGAWLVEIPDMVGFGRREHTQIISAITTRSDPYRASYGRNAEDHPRVTIFVATSESDEYLKDSRGVRRYWPVRCSDFNLKGLTAMRLQLFAEAVVAFKSGASWHEMPAADTASEQAERQEMDVWLEPIAAFCALRSQVTVTEVATYGLEIARSKQTQLEANRISRCLRTLGYSCKVERLSGHPMRVYRK